MSLSAGDWKAITQQPAVLADAVDLLPMLTRVRQNPPEDPQQARAFYVRWADVWRRFSPEEALPVLDMVGPVGPELEPDHLTWAAVRAATLLEVQRADEAEPLVASVGLDNGAQDLLFGRLAYLREDLEGARAHWERADALAALHGHPLSIEVRAEALGFLGRLTVAEGHADETGVWSRLDRVCEEANAKLSQSISRLYKAAGDMDVYETLAVGYAVQGRRMLEKTYAEPHAALVETLAPIPVSVHGIAKAHADDPRTYAQTVYQLAALCWRMGDRQVAYEHAWYGRAIGVRLFGPEIGVGFDAFIDELLRPLEPGAREAFQWRLKKNSDGAQRAKRARMGEG